MTNQEFEILVNKFFDGNISEEELLQLEKFRKSNPEFEEVFLKYENLFTNISRFSTSNEVPVEMWSSIEKNITKSSPKIEKISDNYLKFSTGKKSGSTDIHKERIIKPFWVWTSLTIIFIVFISVIVYKGFNSNLNYGDNTLSMIGFNWKITSVSGNITINGKPASQVDELSIGDWIETDELSSATINIPDIGNITLEPGTKIRLVQSDGDKKKIELQYGTINSDTRASTSNLYINSDKTTAIDLGSMFSFAVDKNGEGLIFVKDGSVKVKSDKRDAIIPPGQFCYVMTNLGPGTPFNKYASKEFKKALMQYDFYDGGAEALASAFSVAGFSDAISLVNLIPTVYGHDKVAVFNKVSNYVAPPGSIHKDSIKYYDVEKLKEWILEIQNQVEKNIEPVLKELKGKVKINTANLNESLSGFDKEEFKEEMKKFGDEMRVFSLEMKSGLKNNNIVIPKVHGSYTYSFTTPPDMNFNFDFSDLDEAVNINLNEELKKLDVELKKIDVDVQGIREEIKIDVIRDLKKAETDLELEIDKAGDFEKDILIKTRDKIREERKKVESNINDKNEE